MYDTEMVQDMQNKFTSAKAVELLRNRDFQLACGSNTQYFKGLDIKLRANKECYDAQWQSDLAEMNSFSDHVISVQEKSNTLFYALGGIFAGLVGYKIYSSKRSALRRRKDGQDI